MSVRATQDLGTVTGLKRTDVLWECETVEPDPFRGPDAPTVVRRRDDMYGDCSTRDGSPCSLPLQITTSPACEGSVDDLLETIESGLGPDGKLIRRRGVRVVSMEDGRSLHIATGRLTIAIFADTAKRASGALRALRASRKDPAGKLPREVRRDPGSDPLCHNA